MLKKERVIQKISLENISKMLIKQKKFSTYFTYREASLVWADGEDTKLTKFC